VKTIWPLVALSLAMTLTSCGDKAQHDMSHTKSNPNHGHYVARLNGIDIAKTRALFRDTDHVAFVVRHGDVIILDEVRSLGDLGRGWHDIGMQVEFDAPADGRSDITLSYTIVNRGNYSDVSAFLNGLSEKTRDLLNEYYAMGGLWNYAHTFTMWLNGLMVGGCDGLVAADVMFIDLANATAFEESRNYSYESQSGCGASPRYAVNWSVTRM
jgi:hypothetical protein